MHGGAESSLHQTGRRRGEQTDTEKHKEDSSRAAHPGSGPEPPCGPQQRTEPVTDNEPGMLFDLMPAEGADTRPEHVGGPLVAGCSIAQEPPRSSEQEVQLPDDVVEKSEY